MRIFDRIQKNKGMTYVELIVVLSIFSVLGSVVMFNYGTFQDRVDMKNLANDIALKIVEAQKSSISGKLPLPLPPSSWKPAYGVYFNITGDSKGFVYFTDLDNNTQYPGTIACSTAECLNKTTITKGNYISEIRRFPANTTVNDLGVNFTRPNSEASFSSGGSNLSGISYFQITVVSPKGNSAQIKVYSSGRIQVN